MADFKAEVVRLTIEEHPNADALELARVGDYVSIVQKGAFKTGDLGVYIPEQAVLEDWLIATLGLEGRLAGKAKNRVKAIRLRGIFSQGLILPLHFEEAIDADFNAGTSRLVPMWVLDFSHIEMGPMRVRVELGDDVTKWLSITKYEPIIPTHMNGQVFNASGYTMKYDIENIKGHPDVFNDDEIVVITEKLHGTWCCFGYHPDAETVIVSSKGMSGKGLAFKLNEENEHNLYVKTYRQFAESLQNVAVWFVGQPVYILGEIFGRGVQDLHYGALQPQFRVFDIYVGNPGQGDYMPAGTMQKWVEEELSLPSVPHLYTGPFDKNIIEELTNGKETVSGDEANVREGIVIKPLIERRNDELGRVVLKSVSEDYLLRKGNTTEFN